MTHSPPERLPRLTDTIEPIEVAGTAALTTAAMRGTPLDALLRLVDDIDPDPVARLFDMGLLCQLASRRDDAMNLQMQVIRSYPILRVRHASLSAAPLRVLALAAPGDLMVNTPLDFITAHLDVRLDLLFLVPGQKLPDAVPDHDVLFVAVSDADPALLERIRRLVAAWPRPVLNDPTALPLLARDRLSTLLSDVPGVFCPPTVPASPAQLQAILGSGGAITDLLPGADYPILVRPHGSHAGHGLEKLDGPDALAAYLGQTSASAFYLSAFVDYRSPDDRYRKYRVAFMDRQAGLCHMAVSPHWMVHYLNAGMTEHADRRADEAAAMAAFDDGFARRHQAAFAAMHDRLPFDYYSIDCAELPDGQLLVFEADTGAIIHLMEDPADFPYKHTQMRRVFATFDAMLRRRLDDRFGPMSVGDPMDDPAPTRTVEPEGAS